MSRPIEKRTDRIAARCSSYAGLVVVSMGLACAAVTITAQQPAADSAPATDKATQPSALDELAVAQGKVADKYGRLEQLLIRMAELEAVENPQRAALLKRAAQQSSDRLTRQQLNTLIKLLTPPAQLKRAIDEQQQVVTDLRALLELLQSENRSDRLKNEKTRIRQYIQEVERLIKLQNGVQGRNEGGEDPKKLAIDQEQVANRTGELAQQIRENEEGSQSKNSSSKSSDADEKEPSKGDSNAKENGSEKSPAESGKEKSPDDASKEGGKEGSDSKDGNTKKGEDTKQTDQGKAGTEDAEKSKSDAEKSAEKQPNDGQQDGSPSESKPDGKSTDSKNGEKNKSSKGDSSKSKQSNKSSESGEQSESSENQSGEQQPEQPEQENPARKRLEAAQERMREAQRKLSEAQGKEATEDQEKAREELVRAKAELEQILRQLREEEVERTLALLEGRFRHMLDGQMKVYESTKRLDKIPADQRTRDLDIESSKLSFDESKLAVEADKALLLLREEGSSVAFPETVEMLRDDMQTVAERLTNAKVDQVTQGLEEEIIQSLEELIASLQKAQQDLKDKKPPPTTPGQQPMDPANRPLVDKLAELRMIRSLQLRVNTRTQRYARLLENVDDPVGRANDADLRQSIGKLSDLEKRVFEITRNIVLGKNE